MSKESTSIWRSDDLVVLDADHPGFRDAAYRERRNTIAQVALDHRRGEDVPEVPYTEEEQNLWASICQQLSPMHDRLACREVLEAYEHLRLSTRQIPQLEEVNRGLARATGFRMEPVAGLIGAKQFMAALGDSIFLSTQYIRHVSRPHYTPEPDVVHELLGHAATLAHPAFADLSREFGRAAIQADHAAVERMAQLYWYTLEYGLVRENGQLKLVGAGLLSSFGEMQTFEERARLRPLSLQAADTPYDPTDYQATLFVADDFDSMRSILIEGLAQILAD